MIGPPDSTILGETFPGRDFPYMRCLGIISAIFIAITLLSGYHVILNAPPDGQRKLVILTIGLSGVTIVGTLVQRHFKKGSGSCS